MPNSATKAAPSPADRVLKSRARALLLGAGFVVVLLQFGLFSVPWRPWYMWEYPDPSWNYILHYAWLKGLAFGREIIWPYGPLGFSYLDFFQPDTYTSHLLARAFVASGLTLACWWLARAAFPSGLAAFAWMCAFPICFGRDYGAQLLTLPALLLAVQASASGASPVERRNADWVSAFVLLVMATSGLMKFTALVAGGVASGLLSVYGGLRRSRAVWALPVYVVGVSALWCAVGQDGADLAPYLWSSLALSGGLHAVSSGFFPWELGLFALACVGVLASLALSAFDRREPALAMLGLGLGGLLFLAFKGGFVRQDAHATTAATVVMAFSLIGLALCSGRPRWLAALAVIAALAAYDNSARTHHGRTLTAHLGYRVTELPEAAWHAWRVIGGDRSFQQYLYDDRMRGIRQRIDLAGIEGSVDVYPWKHGALFAHDLDYRPRPVVQSQLAYTPELVEANAAALRGPDAPEVALVEIDPIGDLHPGLQDGAVLLELLGRYDPVSEVGGFLRLQRRDGESRSRLQPLADFELPFGREVPKPPEEVLALWAEIDVPLRPMGRLAAFVYRLPKIVLHVTTSAGDVERNRLVPGISKGGFLLSPHLQDARTLNALARGERERLAPAQVESWSLETSSPGLASWLYQTPRVRLYRLELEPLVPRTAR